MRKSVSPALFFTVLVTVLVFYSVSVSGGTSLNSSDFV